MKERNAQDGQGPNAINIGAVRPVGIAGVAIPQVALGRQSIS
jgi:hypothetical protein